MTPHTPPEGAACIPEWCEPMGRDDEHSDTCPQHPFPTTKQGFVDGAEASARGAITAYLVIVGDGFTHDEALDMAVDEAIESATCWVGIGSCGRGWCKHN